MITCGGMTLSYIAVLALLATSAAEPFCRCTPTSACWSAIPWPSLNASVGGRLAASVDPLAACLTDVNGTDCDSLLSRTDDEFWLSSVPSGFLHTGQFGAWNLSTQLSSYVLLAQSESDIQQNTGHDWYGRSTAPGALLIWTHLRKDILFTDDFTPAGCSLPEVPAVTVQSGVQFNDLYAAAQEHGRLVIGGTCDSVGVGGCWLGGCFGTFSKLYGSAASNLLQAKVVLANGSLVIANACTNPDLFWALRGGGGGLGGVVTEFTARTHRPPSFVLLGGHHFTARDREGYQLLLEQLLLFSKAAMQPPYGGSISFGRLGEGGSVSLGPKGFEVPQSTGEALLKDILALVASNTSRYTASVSWSYWNASSYTPGGGLPWMENHPDREISTALLSSFSKLPSMRQLETPAGVSAMASAFLNLSYELPTTANGVVGLDFEKGQAGASSAALELLDETSQNPVLHDALGLLLVMYNVPYLPTLPPSSRLLSHLWPRLKQYVFLDSSDSLYAICTSGAAGIEVNASACLDGWLTQRVPALQAQLAVANDTLWRAFPSLDSDGIPLSGSYLNEADYFDPEWQRTQWGDEVYARLRAVKAKYDPSPALFVCHHCVGSEDWSADGNCLLE